MPEDQLRSLYRTDEYLRKHPELHREDSAWKLGAILPALDCWRGGDRKTGGLRVLDVGGGAGLILRETAGYLRERHGGRVEKFALDLSPGMLIQQRQTNPDLAGEVEGDICQTAFPDKFFDLVLLIDVLEHVPDPRQALAELRRISRWVLLKVPLESNLILNLANTLNRGRTRAALATELGHINYYTPSTLKRQIVEHLGPIRYFRYMDQFSFVLANKGSLGGVDKLGNRLGRLLYRFAPPLAARVFTEMCLVLVECK